MSEHGGDWAGFQQEYGKLPLDFSANINPLGMPKRVRQAIVQNLDSAERYPDPVCRELRQKLAQLHHLSERQILCGAGAADLIFRLVLAKKPRRALITAPTFAEYENALSLVQCTVTHYPLSVKDNFLITEEILSYITSELDLLILCEPNNPTGRTTAPALLQKILHRCAACETLLVVDECFNAFLDDPAAHSLQSALQKNETLVILRAFTKSHALAGLRLGYALCGDRILVEQMQKAGPPWSVSTLAQIAGVAALQGQSDLQSLRKLLSVQRQRMQTALAAMGCYVCPGEANYLLFYYPDADLAQRLRGYGILLRDCSNYRGLGVGWYRTAIRTAEENDIFLQRMHEVI